MFPVKRRYISNSEDMGSLFVTVCRSTTDAFIEIGDPHTHLVSGETGHNGSTHPNNPIETPLILTSLISK